VRTIHLPPLARAAAQRAFAARGMAAPDWAAGGTVRAAAIAPAPPRTTPGHAHPDRADAWASAWHEAGHVVFACVRWPGDDVIASASLFAPADHPDGDRGQAELGRLPVGATAGDRALFCVAGPAAQQWYDVLTGGALRTRVRSALGERGDREDFARVLGLAADTPGFTAAWLDHFDRAERFLRGHLPGVQAVAAALFARGHLTGEECRRLAATY